MPYIKQREYNGRGKFEFKFKMLEPLETEADFKIYFFSNARIMIETSFLFSTATEKIISENQKGLFDVSLNGIVTDNIGTISIEKMAINSININAKKGEIIKLQLELRCFTTVNIIYSDEKSGTMEVHYGLTNFIFSGSVRGPFLLNRISFCSSITIRKKIKKYWPRAV